MEEKNTNHNYLFDDRELDGLENIEELSDEELEKAITEEERKQLEKEIEELTKDISL